MCSQHQRFARVKEIVNLKGYIAIVEPDDLIRELLKRWLGEAGYGVVLSPKDHSMVTPQLAIADISSPKGADTLIRALRAAYSAPILALSACRACPDRIQPAIPILLVSGYLSTAVVRRAREAAADEVLKEPLSARELASSLAGVLHAVAGRRREAVGVSTSTRPEAGRRRRSAATRSAARPARRR